MCFLPLHDSAEDSSSRGITRKNDSIALLQVLFQLVDCVLLIIVMLLRDKCSCSLSQHVCPPIGNGDSSQEMHCEMVCTIAGSKLKLLQPDASELGIFLLTAAYCSVPCFLVQCVSVGCLQIMIWELALCLESLMRMFWLVGYVYCWLLSFMGSHTHFCRSLMVPANRNRSEHYCSEANGPFLLVNFSGLSWNWSSHVLFLLAALKSMQIPYNP